MLKKREVRSSQVTSRIRRTSHNNGIEEPTSLNHSVEIDSRNKNTFWRDVIAKEISSIGVAFDMLETGNFTPVGFNRTSGHITFDAKMDFTGKAKWVLDGHGHPSPEGSTYAGVVSQESVRIAFTYASLNDVDVWTCDIQNAYLQASTTEKCYFICVK